MLEVTEKATEMVREFFKSRDKVQPLRIIVAGVGWKGPTLGMALDEPNDKDEVFTEAEFTFIIEKTLLEQAKPVNIDYISNAMGQGFVITSGMASDADCGGCTSCWTVSGDILKRHICLNMGIRWYIRGIDNQLYVL